MALALAEIILLGLLVDYLFRRMRIPGLVGMMLVGVLLGPEVLGFIRPDLLALSGDLRMVALIVILLRAGFELRLETLRQIGVQALLLACVPALFEGAAITMLGPGLLGLTRLESALLGSVLAAVSPAVVVPMMLDFQARRMGTRKGIPMMVVAASSIDDIFVIVMFTALLGMYLGDGGGWAARLAGIPVSMLLGIAAGGLCGWGLYWIFRRFRPRSTKRLMVILGAAVVLVGVESRIEALVPFAALLAVMAVGAVILQENEHMAREISGKLAKLWVVAEVVLFTLVGTQVDLDVAWRAGLAGSALIGLGLLARCLGTYLCLAGSRLSQAERLFVVLAYIPKATVQAAIGGAPLLALRAAGQGTGPGEIILAVAVLSIVLTAPLGAWVIAFAGHRILRPETSVPGTEAEGAEPADIVTVEDVMNRDVVSIRENQSLRALLKAFAAGTFSACPVVNARGVLTGMVDMETLRPVLASEQTWKTLIAADLEEEVPLRLKPGQALKAALEQMAAADLDEAFVVESRRGALVGMVSAEAARRRLKGAGLEPVRPRSVPHPELL